MRGLIKFLPLSWWMERNSLLLLTVFVLGVSHSGYGQDPVRRYANRAEFRGQALAGILFPGTIENSGGAVDGNVKTHSTLRVDVGALNQSLATQFIDFGKRYVAGTPVTIKLSLPASALGLVNNFIVQPYTGLNFGGGVLGIGDHWRATQAGTAFSGANLLNLLSGKGTMELTIIPTAAFDGIWIQLGSITGLGVSMDIYHAYVMETGPTWSCEERGAPMDVLAGTRAAAADLAGALSTVTNPYDAMNGDLNSYAEMNVVLGALNTTYLNTVFPTPSVPNQNIRIVLENPGGLLNLNLLSSFSIQPLLRDQAAGPPIASSNPSLNLRLLPGSTKYEFVYRIAEPFDRIELRFANTVSALTSLRIYEVSRSARVMLIEDPHLLMERLSGCGAVDLSAAIANYEPELYTYHYYNAPTGGTALPSSAVTSSGTYYLEAVDPMTGCPSPRVAVHANVYPISGRATIDIIESN